MCSSQAAKDKLVRATDLDALSCRLSANRKGYFSPPDKFILELLASYEQNLQFCEGYTQLSAGRTVRSSFKEPKFPLINRGTYFRTQSIDLIVNSFIQEWGHCQIVALGGGSDTRAFRVLETFKNVSYIELDFAESTKIKKIAISNSDSLKAIVNADSLGPIEISSNEEMADLEPDLHTSRYHLVSFDLRQLPTKGAQSLAFLDKSLPTLVISECVLCYLAPGDWIAVLDFWKSLLPSMAVILYDPMGLGDTFGDTMAQNLSKRGLDLLSFIEFPDLASRKNLFESTLGFKAKLTDLASVGGYSEKEYSWVDSAESSRVSKLEMVDEVEEIILLLKHYCLLYAESGISSKFVSDLSWLL